MPKGRGRTPGRRRTRRTVRHKGRFIVFLLVLALLGGAIYLWGGTLALYLQTLFSKQVMPAAYEPSALSIYFSTAKKYDVPWYLLAAVDRAEGVETPESQRTDNLARILAKAAPGATDSQILRTYNSDDSFVKDATDEVLRLSAIDGVLKDKVFPLFPDAAYEYADSWGEERNYGGKRLHEGTDIFAEKGTPVRSVCDGRVEKMGWLEMGGWRLGIRGKDGMYYYYAHLERYEDGLQAGDVVAKGQVIGYLGDSGYGPEGTTGEFEPHLHFGIYQPVEKAFSPYPFLLWWDGKAKAE